MLVDQNTPCGSELNFFVWSNMTAYDVRENHSDLESDAPLSATNFPARPAKAKLD